MKNKPFTDKVNPQVALPIHFSRPTFFVPPVKSGIGLSKNPMNVTTLIEQNAMPDAETFGAGKTLEP